MATKTNNALAKKLTESAVMISLATILSFIKLLELPYGGAITIASMLPILIIAIRYGVLWGFFSGLTYGAVQFVLGISILKYATSAGSAIAIIVLDYILAFAVIALGGLTRKIKNQTIVFGLGAIIASIARYLCHVISGATVWAGISIPTKEALIYSIGYNATYMLPEMLVLLIVALYFGSSLDFRTSNISIIKDRTKYTSIKLMSVSLICAIPLIYDIVRIFNKLQDPDSGAFVFSNISSVNWSNLGIVTAVFFVIAYFVHLQICINEIKSKLK